jgi:hypothetical protein
MHSVRYCVLAALLIPAYCFAQRQVALEINHTGTDPGGVALVAELREAIRVFERLPASQASGSQTVEPYGLRLTGGVTRPRIKLQLLTSELQPGPRTAAVISLTYNSDDMPLAGAFIRSTFEACGPDERAACAKRILLKAAAAVDWLRDNWPALWQTL